jgi:hypothetical protein
MRPPHFKIAASLAIAIAATASAETFRFWPGKGASSAPGFKGMSDHPCGEVAEAEVSKLPSPNYEPLGPDLVVELNRRGKVIRRWPAPVDHNISAVKGDKILVTAGERAFWIRPDGSFKKEAVIPQSSVTLAECDLTSVFGKSAYARCAIYRDLATGKKRTLGYQGVCS